MTPQFDLFEQFRGIFTQGINPPSTSYFNTIPLKGADLKQARRKAANQDDLVLKCFTENKYQAMTPAQVFLMLGQQYPITSIRRAITNLTKAGLLVMTDEKRAGLYGTLNNTWKLK